MIIVAAVLTAIIRKIRDEYVEAEILNFREEQWHRDERLPKYIADKNHTVRPKPPSAEFVAEARRRRFHEAKMVDVILEIVVYSCYLCLCLLIAYGHRDPDAFRATHHVEQMFFYKHFEEVMSYFDSLCRPLFSS